MKEKLILLILLLGLTLPCYSQSKASGTENFTPQQKSTIDEIGKLNTELISLYSQKRLPEALKVAKQAQNLIAENNLNDSLTTVPTLNNVAEVYLATGDEAEALKIFLALLNIYKQKLGEENPQYSRMLDRIAVAYSNKGDHQRAAEYAQQALGLMQKMHGIQSKETSSAYENLAKAYWKDGKWELANGAFLQMIDINDKIMSADEKRERKDVDGYDCFVSHWGFADGDFLEKRRRADEFLKVRRERERGIGEDKKLTSAGVVNGKATYLAKPAYPAAAAGRPGFVVVKVEIDEKGNVTKATATCGITTFLRVSEEAARQAIFKPTTLNGVPVKVSGLIVYNFGR